MNQWINYKRVSANYNQVSANEGALSASSAKTGRLRLAVVTVLRSSKPFYISPRLSSVGRNSSAASLAGPAPHVHRAAGGRRAAQHTSSSSRSTVRSVPSREPVSSPIFSTCSRQPRLHMKRTATLRPSICVTHNAQPLCAPRQTGGDLLGEEAQLARHLIAPLHLQRQTFVDKPFRASSEAMRRAHTRWKRCAMRGVCTQGAGKYPVGKRALERGLVGVEVLELQQADLAQRRHGVVRRLGRQHQLRSTEALSAACREQVAVGQMEQDSREAAKAARVPRPA